MGNPIKRTAPRAPREGGPLLLTKAGVYHKVILILAEEGENVMRRPLTISIEEEDARDLKRMCEIMGITVSSLFESSIRGYLLVAKTSGLFKKKKASPADMIRLLSAGADANPL